MSAMSSFSLSKWFVHRFSTGFQQFFHRLKAIPIQRRYLGFTGGALVPRKVIHRKASCILLLFPLFFFGSLPSEKDFGGPAGPGPGGAGAWGVESPGIDDKRLFKHTSMEVAVAGVLPVRANAGRRNCAAVPRFQSFAALPHNKGVGGAGGKPGTCRPPRPYAPHLRRPACDWLGPPTRV